MQASSSSSSRIHGKRWNLRLTGRKRGSLVGLEQARRGKVKGHGRSTSFMVHCSLGEDRHFHRGHYLYDIADFSAAEQHEQLVLGAPPRPRRIILVRHGQSEGNIDEGAYTRIPDSKISLTEAGWRQAIECGKRIRTLVESDGAPDWKVYFYVSPYRRSLQTLKAIGMAFERERIAGVREEPRLREQDFGNFQDQERMRVEKEIRLRYGRFFYRFPNGESAADVYDRITGFRETLRADIDIGRFQRPEDRSKNVNLVLVSHGLTLRVFLMRWYKWTVEQFEGLWNFGNTGTMVMETGPGGRYSLLVHHTREELKAFGMTECMIDDQEWQKYAKPGELNYDWLTSGSNFFSHFDSDKDELSQMPSEIKDASSMRDFFQPEPPVGWPS
ncbi:phosphoglycerate mutase-like protein AT74H [Selaginella moellendorffii]|nr:phosphoglycerate mutase-like protein AT74H [Selaginella moellendorffii]|eukprot:XP_002968785.2 phosphoglycerate mutase-like protein AT74H [Selaginella moellendorffii]